MGEEAAQVAVYCRAGKSRTIRCFSRSCKGRRAPLMKSKTMHRSDFEVVSCKRLRNLPDPRRRFQPQSWVPRSRKPAIARPDSLETVRKAPDRSLTNWQVVDITEGLVFRTEDWTLVD